MSQSQSPPPSHPQAQSQPPTSTAAPNSTPTNAPAPAPTSAPTTAPAPVPAPVPAPIPATVSPQPQTFTQKLTAGDRHWVFKIVLRAVLIIVGIIGIGCMGWIVATRPIYISSFDYFDDSWATPWTLITFAVSVIWCTICVLVFLFRRPNAPVHPGVRVGIDLILWLAFIITATFALIALLDLRGWASDGYIGRYSSDGYYYQVENGTWVYNATEYDTYYGSGRDCNSSSRYSYYSDYSFSSCEEQDAYVNQLWQQHGKRVDVETTGVVCQFIALLVHLALFIWACVDTHYRNKTKLSKDAEKLAADIVMKMVQSGAIIPAPGQAHMQPPMAQHFMQPQPFPPQHMGPWPQQQPRMPPQAAPAPHEKGHGSYYR